MRRIAHFLLPVLLATTAMTGCGKIREITSRDTGPKDNGVATLEPSAILAKARSALMNAGSYHMKGDYGTKGGGANDRVAIDVKAKGSDMAGLFTLQSDGSSPQGKIEVIRVGSDAYFKADTTFLQTVGKDGADSQAMIEVLKNRWFKPGDTSEFFKFILQLTDPELLLNSQETVTKGELTKIGEVDVITVKDGKATVYVATKGEPYPIRLENLAGEGGQIDFSEFGATFEIKAPPDDQVVDLEKLR